METAIYWGAIVIGVMALVFVVYGILNALHYILNVLTFDDEEYRENASRLFDEYIEDVNRKREKAKGENDAQERGKQ